MVSPSVENIQDALAKLPVTCATMKPVLNAIWWHSLVISTRAALFAVRAGEWRSTISSHGPRESSCHEVISAAATIIKLRRVK